MAKLVEPSTEDTLAGEGYHVSQEAYDIRECRFYGLRDAPNTRKLASIDHSLGGQWSQRKGSTSLCIWL